MKLIFRFIKGLVITIVVLIIATLILGFGYYCYAIYKTPVELKISSIMNDKNYVELSDISPDFINAVIAVEDPNHYEHGAVNLRAIIKAVEVNLSSKDLVMGGSTISQQVAKNVFFTQDRNFIRKTAEVFMAYDLERKYSKDEILTIYVNINYYGDNYTGIKQAALGYFNVLPSELTVAQATLLAGIPNAPTAYRLSDGFELAKKRQRIVLDCMIEVGFLTKEQADIIYESKVNYGDN